MTNSSSVCIIRLLCWVQSYTTHTIFGVCPLALLHSNPKPHTTLQVHHRPQEHLSYQYPPLKVHGDVTSQSLSLRIIKRTVKKREKKRDLSEKSSVDSWVFLCRRHCQNGLKGQIVELPPGEADMAHEILGFMLTREENARFLLRLCISVFWFSCQPGWCFCDRTVHLGWPANSSTLSCSTKVLKVCS